MLDRALTITFRNLSTLFLVAAVFFVPLHLVHAFLFRDVLAVAELRPEIASFPETKKVRNVGPAEFADERTALGIVFIVEAGLLVVVLGAALRVVEVDRNDDVPTVGDALADSMQSLGRVRLQRPGVVVLCGAIGALAAWLVYRIGLLATELLGNDTAFAGVGLARGAAVSLFATFVAGPIAALSAESPDGTPPERLDVYG